MISIGALIGVSSKISSRFSASSRVSLLLAIATLGLRFLARSTKTEESVELDPVSDFEDLEEEVETFSLFCFFRALLVFPGLPRLRL
jgi:hypothetical protein